MGSTDPRFNIGLHTHGDSVYGYAEGVGYYDAKQGARDFVKPPSGTSYTIKLADGFPDIAKQAVPPSYGELKAANSSRNGLRSNWSAVDDPWNREEAAIADAPKYGAAGTPEPYGPFAEASKRTDTPGMRAAANVDTDLRLEVRAIEKRLKSEIESLREQLNQASDKLREEVGHVSKLSASRYDEIVASLQSGADDEAEGVILFEGWMAPNEALPIELDLAPDEVRWIQIKAYEKSGG